LLEEGLWLLGSNSKQKINDEPHAPDTISPDGHGNLWYFYVNDNYKVELKRYTSNGQSEDTNMEFEMGHGPNVYGCNSSTSVFVTHQPYEVDGNVLQIMYVSQDAESGQWSSLVIGECLHNNTKFASDGNGGLWALSGNGNNCRFWKCNEIMMEPALEWDLSFASAELVGG